MKRRRFRFWHFGQLARIVHAGISAISARKRKTEVPVLWSTFDEQSRVNFRERRSPLVRDDYVAVLESVASGLVPGARIYDALLLRAAAKCIPDRIYTFNLRDFRSLAPGEIAGTITEP